MNNAFTEHHAEKYLRSKMQSGIFDRLFSEKNLNGVDHKVTLREVWEKYKTLQLPTLSEAACPVSHNGTGMTQRNLT